MKEKRSYRRLALVTGLFIILSTQGCGDIHHSAADIDVNAASNLATENGVQAPI
jgi:hypothetical protein